MFKAYSVFQQSSNDQQIVDWNVVESIRVKHRNDDDDDVLVSPIFV